MADKPATTWAEMTRSTEEEHQKFMKALRKLTFTKEEFLKHGPEIILKKHEEFLKDIKDE